MFKTHGRCYELLDFEVVHDENSNFIILENLTLEPGCARQLYLFFSPTGREQKVKLGRGHDAELRINDISVSRLHATLLFKND